MKVDASFVQLITERTYIDTGLLVCVTPQKEVIESWYIACAILLKFHSLLIQLHTVHKLWVPCLRNSSQVNNWFVQLHIDST